LRNLNANEPLIRLLLLLDSGAMGKVKKGMECSVKGCSEPAVRSVSYADYSAAGLGGSAEPTAGRVYLCEKHYKEYKKAAKKLRKLQKWRWMA